METGITSVLRVASNMSSYTYVCVWREKQKKIIMCTNKISHLNSSAIDRSVYLKCDMCIAIFRSFASKTKIYVMHEMGQNYVCTGEIQLS